MIIDADLLDLVKQADTGIRSKQFDLARKYLNGWGVKQDNIKAYKYYLKSAKQGYPLSCYVLAEFYYDKHNYRRCAHWAEIAVKNHAPIFDDWVDTNTIKLMLAISLDKSGDYPQAWALFKELAQVEGDDQVSRAGRETVKEYVGKVVRFRKNREEGLEFLTS